MPSLPSNEFEPLPSTSLRLRINYWVLTHFSTLRRVLIGALVAAIVILFGVSTWRAIPILQDPGLVDRIAAEVAAMRPYVPTRPEPLELGEVVALPTPGATQLLATVTNPNTDRVAKSISYEFRTPDGRTLASGWTWLMPGETRYAAGVAAGDEADAVLTVTSQSWATQREHDPIQPLQLTAGDVGLEAISGQPSRATFVAANADPVGYRTVQAIAVARSGGAILAVGTLNLNDLRSGEERQSALTWYHPVPAGAQVEVQLVTNPFDRANILLAE